MYNRLKTMRKVKRLTQQEVAKVFNVTQNTYSYWENGKVNLDNTTIAKLAEFFGVSIDFLLGRKYKITIPFEKWHSSIQEEYNQASPFLKEYIEYKNGGVIFTLSEDGVFEPQNNIEKTPPPNMTEEANAIALLLADFTKDETEELSNYIDYIISKRK